MKTIVFIDADFDLFKTCFMEDGEWDNCKFEVAPDPCSAGHLASLLTSDNVSAVVFQEGRTKHWEALKQLGFTWRFSSYTCHEFELTPKAISHLGNSAIQQQYTKSNLISAPEEDRWMVPKTATIEEYVSDIVGYSEEATADEETLDEIREAKANYPKHIEELRNQCPLAVHEGPNGGKFIYLGFVNGDGNIPKYVRGAIMGEKITASE
eukprot:scaffold7302_cov72-Cyclotella_meneghiniana.AAC.15